MLEDYLGWDELRATKFVLYPQNHTELDALVDCALAAHTAYLDRRLSDRRALETVAWDVPVFEYNTYYQEYAAPTHGLQPTSLHRRSDGNLAYSKEEMMFIQFLEDDYHAPRLRWWYKNGAGTRTDFTLAPGTVRSG